MVDLNRTKRIINNMEQGESRLEQRRIPITHSDILRLIKTFVQEVEEVINTVESADNNVSNNRADI